ncbi:hypothetical protein HMN09_00584200 [Mycena chlorophos]|uniref:Histone deacetylase complex subunit SAP30 Sin3 binding domain-containing protein n=1 Tax=Mycena chlorophos TaxID=658473 RepID=A0A8H6T5N2_MYCCL|nr:hypothetical protein HMN09_00584200 [Mycena chlorophos]
MSVPPQPAPASRARTGGRKKVQHDDAAYFSGASGVKRSAAERADGEPRSKRKRVADAIPVPVPREDGRTSLVEFSKMPTPVLYRYLAYYDLVPEVFPSPITALDPPAPASLDKQDSSRGASPPNGAQQPGSSANRPRRESNHGRRRSSRLLDDENLGRPPIMSDVDELHTVLANVAERHFSEMSGLSGREEVETLASFMCEVERCRKIR